MQTISRASESEGKKEREREAIHIEDTERLVIEVEMLKVVFYIWWLRGGKKKRCWLA